MPVGPPVNSGTFLDVKVPATGKFQRMSIRSEGMTNLNERCDFELPFLAISTFRVRPQVGFSYRAMIGKS